MHMQRMMRIDECTKRALYDLLVELDAPIERMIADGWTAAQLKEDYDSMLSRHMEDWQKGKEYFNQLEKKVG